ncbi:MAG: sensor histidine kinase [Phototrophicaceae bacterium]
MKRNLLRSRYQSLVTVLLSVMMFVQVQAALPNMLIGLIFAALLAGYSLLGTFGWAWVRRHGELAMMSYIIVQTILMGGIQGFAVSLVGVPLQALLAFPLMLQIAYLPSTLRWGFWGIVLLVSTFSNLGAGLDITQGLLQATLLSAFAIAGRAVVWQASMQAQFVALLNELETRRLDDQQRFQALTQIRERFISSATHDLKNPLNLVVGYTSLLESHPTIEQDATLRRYLTGIQHGATKMQALITDMLDLAQLTSGAPLQRSETNLNDLIALSLQDFTLAAQDKQIELSFIPAQAIPQLVIDRNRFQRVLDNLISNAVKYTPVGGRVEVRTQFINDKVKIHVKDSGMGIPSAAIPRLFDVFYRVQSKRHQEIEGTGLGLAVVKSIVEQHGGQIEVESMEQVGSVFTVTLPSVGATKVPIRLADDGELPLIDESDPQDNPSLQQAVAKQLRRS